MKRGTEKVLFVVAAAGNGPNDVAEGSLRDDLIQVFKDEVTTISKITMNLKHKLGTGGRPFKKLQESTEAYAATFASFMLFLRRLVRLPGNPYEIPEDIRDVVLDGFEADYPEYFYIFLVLLKKDPSLFPFGDPFVIWVAAHLHDKTAGPSVFEKLEKKLAQVHTPNASFMILTFFS